MTAATNKAIVQRFVTDAIQGGDFNVVKEIFDPAYVPHDPSNPGRQGGIAGATAFVTTLHQHATDVRYDTDHWLADGDLVSYSWSLRFAHSGPLMGIPPSGKTIAITGIDLFRLRDGKVIESWTYADALGMLQQMGMLPPLGPPPGADAQ